MVAKTLADFLGPVLGVAAVKSVTLWHLSDKYSWYGNADWYGAEAAKHGGNPQRRPRTHFFDERLNPKPAWRALEAAFAARKLG